MQAESLPMYEIAAAAVALVAVVAGVPLRKRPSMATEASRAIERLLKI